MTAIKLLVSDVDGTLVDKEKKVTAATVDAVARLRDRDAGFTIISARPRSGMMPIAETLDIDGPMGAFNGGILFTRDGTVLERHAIDPAVARGMMALAVGKAVDRWVFADDVWYASTDRGDHVDSERKASNQAPVVTDDFERLLDSADKITFVSDDEELLASMHDAAADFASRATIVQSQTYYLDVTALAANKGDGITALAKAYEVDLAAIAAIGDQYNDVPMLKVAGYSVAMGNAPAGVQDHADDVTAANDADGVAQAIDQYIIPRIGAAQ